MITLVTKVRVPGLSGRQITDFMLETGDAEYRRWWPGTHLEFHNIRRVAGDVGSLVYFDELVGKRRLRMKALVVEAVPGKRVVWQLKLGPRLPAWLALELKDDPDGVTVTHTIRAGFGGGGRVFDPLVSLFFSRSFRTSMDEHARFEFQKLGELLQIK